MILNKLLFIFKIIPIEQALKKHGLNKTCGKCGILHNSHLAVILVTTLQVMSADKSYVIF